MQSIQKNRNSNLILHLIKSCECYDLTEKESIEIIKKILDKDISRRTYYNYKKKLYDKEIIHQVKDSIYDNHMMRCLLLELEDTDQKMSLNSDFLVYQQLPDRKDIFHNENIQKAGTEELEKTKTMIAKFENQMNEPLQRYDGLRKNANIRKEFIKCGKESCNDCPHGPYYYAYWKDPSTKKLKKKYIGQFNPKE
jgi:hypothetical protein